MSGIDSSDIDTNTATGSHARTLAAVLIVLLLLSPGFLMIFAETSRLNPIVAVAVWAILLMAVLLLARHIRFRRNTADRGDETEDDTTLSRMYHHASQARRTGNPGKFCCSYCETVFELLNAVPVEHDVFLCPGCGARLVLE
jgi:hypothetical protein